MFGIANTMPNSDRCNTCGGHGKLDVCVLDRRGFIHKTLPSVACETCGGRGRFMSAANAAAESYGKQT